MDPNEALAQLREWVESFWPLSRTEAQAQMLFEGLDEWLSNGGHLPAGWERPDTNRQDG